MTLASSSSAQMRYLEESSYGVTPTGVPTNLEMTGEGLAYDISFETSKKIRADRQVSDNVPVGANVSGGVNLEFTYHEYDPFLESILGSTFSAMGEGGVTSTIGTSCTFNSSGNTITAGSAPIGVDAFTNLAKGQWFLLAGSTISGGNKLYKVSESIAPTSTVIAVDISTPVTVDGDGGTSCTISSSRLTNGLASMRSFTFEKEFSDVTQFFAYVGCVPSKLALKFASGAIVDGSIDFVGKNGSRASVTQFPSGIGSVKTSTNNGLMNAVFGVGNILVDGAVLSGTYVKSIDFSVDAKARVAGWHRSFGSGGCWPWDF